MRYTSEQYPMEYNEQAVKMASAKASVSKSMSTPKLDHLVKDYKYKGPYYGAGKPTGGK